MKMNNTSTNKTNRILLAMSTITKLKENIAYVGFIKDYNNNAINKEIRYISQLEPNVKYILDVLPNDNLEIDILCTKDTCEQFSKAIEETAVQYFTKKVCSYIGVNDDCNDIEKDAFIEKDIIIKEIENIKKIKFTYIKIDEDKPEKGIKEVVNHIRNNKINGDFWIDTHGGFRDVSLTLNAVVSLLEVYDIRPKTIIGVRYNDELCLVKNQDNSFAMFDFVSGMNEFIRFGSADYLVEHYENQNNESVKQIIDSMKKISDGTRLCDPNEYMKGLDDLSKSIENINIDDDFFNIFLDYIRADYGDLLNPEKRSPFKVIERCVSKKLYQQALTFIESMMPEEFIKNKIIYYSDNEEDVNNVMEARKNRKKTYVTPEHFFFDTITDSTNYFTNGIAKTKWNTFCSEKFPFSEKEILEKIINRNDYLALRFLQECDSVTDYDKKLWKTSGGNSGNPNVVYLSYENVTINGKKEKQNKYPVHIYTEIKDNEKKEKAAKLFRLHNAIKRCRNMVNHSSQKMRPDLDTIAKALGMYVDLASEVLE